jgi:uncharacterized membrane-anchored protein
MPLPPDHPQRFALANEVHARPNEALTAPERASYVALLVDAEQKAREHAHVAALCERYSRHPPPVDAIHFSADLGPFRLRWERHAEFSSYTFLKSGAAERLFVAPVSTLVPAEWFAGIPGQTIVAAHAELVGRVAALPPAQEIAASFAGNYVVGAEIGEGVGAAFTDFRVHEDGFGRFLIFDRGMSRFQSGRMLQRLFELETYRVMALLTLPVARELSPRLARMERDLAQVTATIAREDTDEPTLLDRVTQLAAEAESTVAATQFRFSAARAYYALVRGRIAELRERRLPGTQTIEEFMNRRLAPAMATCESVAAREVDLSTRVARASRLLSTRVDIVRERQNQALLESMDRRARLQLRLQETVEGLSVAAITYYVVGLIGYLAKGLKAGGMPIDTDIVTGVAIPVVAVMAALALRHFRRSLVRRAEPKVRI